MDEGFVYNPDDPGGATNFGIPLRWYQSVVDENATVETIKHLSRGSATSLYHRSFWANPDVSTISYEDLPAGVGIALFLFATDVEIGPQRAHESLQKALKQLGNRVKIDGILGQRTLAAVRAVDERELISRLGVEVLLYYRSLKKLQFTRGWTFRAVESTCIARELTYGP
jgi:lysozyme family protein